MKTSYNYFEEVRNDIRNYIEWNNIEINEENKEEMQEELNNTLWLDDSVTGNGSGSYTFSAWQAEENLAHNWELLKMACDEFGGDLGEWIARGAEYCDVSIRCYLLAGCLAQVIDEIVG